jgi:hypothetical protein
MSRVDELFTQYKAADAGADPLSFVNRLDGSERQELAALIDAYLTRRPRREFEPDNFAGSRAEQLTHQLDSSLHGAAGLWPLVLPKLRAQADLSPAEMAERLADALDVPNEKERVAGYYEEMEHGHLPAAGVSDRVLDALGAIVGASAGALRQAGAALEPVTGSARTPEQGDEVDRLFTAGRRATR